LIRFGKKSKLCKKSYEKNLAKKSKFWEKIKTIKIEIWAKLRQN